MNTKQTIMERAQIYQDDMIKFMRDLISIPSESCQEKEVIDRTYQEMEKVGFDEIRIDGMGNILGRIGNGSRVIAMDAHMDTVGVGDRESWQWDPYQGKVENGIIYGRGASDMEGAMVSMVYGARIIKDLNLSGDYTLWVVGTVQEEDCDGLCWQYIINEGVLKPDIVIIGEPTNLDIHLGHRGRMEIGVTTKGVSCHGSMPHRGKNAVYMMAKIVGEIESLNERLKDDSFLGKGTVTVSHIECDSPSLCAVPDRAYIHLDRRLTKGETEQTAVEEVKDVISQVGVDASVEVLNYKRASYLGLEYPTKKYFPTWLLDKDHLLCKAAVNNYKDLFDREPTLSRWVFSTNGIATMGMFNIPTIGFGPGNEIFAHTVEDQIPIDHLVKAAAFYAGFPQNYIKV